ncbi:MAG TPA: sulfatase-like hydrolase/transferase [Candidatus Acidoferrales bacterium]
MKLNTSHPRILYLLAAFLFTASDAAWAPSSPAGPNVVLITVDTLRADRLGCYGSKTVPTPVIDALARDGVLFEQAIAQVPLTWPSHAAILTGTYPFSNGVQDFTGQPLSTKIRTLAESFKRNGYATGAVVSSFVLDRSWGLARGFDFYYDTFPGQAFVQKDIALVDRRAKESVSQALRWLQRPRRQPFLFWLHLFDPHSPYDPPEPFRSRYRQHPYDGEVAYVDSQLGRLFAWLKKSGLYDGALIVFLSDHGEALGEHGESEHGFFVYDSTVRVPLIIKPPSKLRTAQRRIPGPVETISVAPTVLQLAGLHDPIERQFQAPSLAGAVTSGPPAAGDQNRPAYSETFYPFSSFGWSPLRSVHSARYHFIEAPEPELYNLQADPQEQHNLVSQESAVAASLRKQLQDLIGRYQPRTDTVRGQPSRPPDQTSGPSAEAIEKLRSLGYVAYRAPASRSLPTSGLADPKSKLWEYQAILEATDAFRAGKGTAARSILKKVQDADPKLYLIPFMLGEAASREGDWAAAVPEFRRCLELNPYFDQAMMGLARALNVQGEADQAKQWLERALAINPQNFRAWYELARVQARSDATAARSSLEKALAIQPNFAFAFRDLGLLDMRQEKFAAASQNLEKAVKLGLTDAATLNFLGITYSRTNRLDLAMESYRRALAANPNHAEAHLNLGYVYERRNEPARARQEYETACRLDKNLCKYVRSTQN